MTKYAKWRAKLEAWFASSEPHTGTCQTLDPNLSGMLTEAQIVKIRQLSTSNTATFLLYQNERWAFVTATVQHNRITAMWVNGFPSADGACYFALDSMRPDIIGTATIEAYYADGKFPLGVQVVQR